MQQRHHLKVLPFTAVLIEFVEDGRRFLDPGTRSYAKRRAVPESCLRDNAKRAQGDCRGRQEFVASIKHQDLATCSNEF